MPSHPFRTAVERRELDAMLDTLAPDVVFRSPLISVPFCGRRQVGELFGILAESMLFSDDFRYTDELASGDTVFLAFRTRVRNIDVQGVDLLQLDEAGKVRDFAVFLRPLPAAAAVAQTLSPRIAARESRTSGAMAGLGVRPLFALTRVFDAVASRMVRRGALGA